MLTPRPWPPVAYRSRSMSRRCCARPSTSSSCSGSRCAPSRSPRRCDHGGRGGRDRQRARASSRRVPHELADAIEPERSATVRRASTRRAGAGMRPLGGRTVIVVDEGVGVGEPARAGRRRGAEMQSRPDRAELVAQPRRRPRLRRARGARPQRGAGLLVPVTASADDSGPSASMAGGVSPETREPPTEGRPR